MLEMQNSILRHVTSNCVGSRDPSGAGGDKKPKDKISLHVLRMDNTFKEGRSTTLNMIFSVIGY